MFRGCMHVYIHMHIHIHIYIHIHIFIYMHVYIHACLPRIITASETWKISILFLDSFDPMDYICIYDRQLFGLFAPSKCQRTPLFHSPFGRVSPIFISRTNFFLTHKSWWITSNSMNFLYLKLQYKASFLCIYCYQNLNFRAFVTISM